MPISRRNFFRNLGAGAVAASAAPALRAFPLAPAAELALCGNSAPPPSTSAAQPLLLYRNENPYGPSEKVLNVLRESASVANRYPRTEYDTLLDQLAALHKVKREQIVLGCGSGEILCMAAMTFLKPGKKLVEAAPTFPALGRLAQTAGVEVADVPLDKMYEHDLPQMLSRAVAPNANATGLEYTEYVRLGIKRNIDDRQEFMNQVNARMLRAIDSQTNFVMVNPMRPPEEVIAHLKKNNILIGPKYPVLDKYIRVSLGKPAEMQQFWRIWDQMPPAPKMSM